MDQFLWMSLLSREIPGRALSDSKKNLTIGYSFGLVSSTRRIPPNTFIVNSHFAFYYRTRRQTKRWQLDGWVDRRHTSQAMVRSRKNNIQCPHYPHPQLIRRYWTVISPFGNWLSAVRHDQNLEQNEAALTSMWMFFLHWSRFVIGSQG